MEEAKETTKKPRTLLKVLTSILACGIVGGGFFAYYAHATNQKQQQVVNQWLEEQEKAKRLEERVKEIQGKLDGSEETNHSLSAKIDELTTQIDDLLTEEIAVFDAAMIQDEIMEIGELATMEYHYTNAGTIDSSKQFELIGLKVPFSSKTAVVTMDGLLKVGIDVKAVTIECNEETRTIHVKIPEAKILSNELDESSLVVYAEENGLFNNLKLEDGSAIRTEIKNKAKENAEKNKLFQQAEEKAQQMIRSLIEAVPAVKECYTIVFN